MNPEQKKRMEELQRLIAKTIATNSAGRNLLLIGGFRYRFLDESVRVSDDMDYHWSGDLSEKQKELLALFERKLLPEVRRHLRYECSARPRAGPDADSPAVQVVDLAFWREDSSSGRIEIPVEVTRIPRADPVIVRTAGGTVYPTVSDADMIESKVIAIINRAYLQYRDIVDVFLFRDQFPTDSRRRLAAKLKALDIPESVVERRMSDLLENRASHARAVQEVLDSQLDPAAAEQLKDAGGGEMVLVTVLTALSDLLPRGSVNRKTGPQTRISGEKAGHEGA